jgi:predicted GTPase
MELEHQALQNADVLFYVLDNQTRGVVVMIEVAYYVAKQRNVVLVINGFKEPGQRICNEPISQM